MIRRFKSYIDKEFGSYPQSQQLVELKEELVSVLLDKFNAAVEEGLNELDAYTRAIESMADLREQYKDEMNALQFSTKEVVKKGKELFVFSIWYYVGLATLFLILTLGLKIPVGEKKTYMIFPDGAFLYVILLMLFINYNTKLNKSKAINRLALFVIPPMAALTIFLNLGIFAGLWHPTWLLFIAGVAVAIMLDGLYAKQAGKTDGVIPRMAVGGGLALVTVQLFLMLAKVGPDNTPLWSSSWLIYVVAAFAGLIVLSIKWTRK